MDISQIYQENAQLRCENTALKTLLAQTQEQARQVFCLCQRVQHIQQFIQYTLKRLGLEETAIWQINMELAQDARNCISVFVVGGS